jgi:hypothetical protein
MKNSDILMNPNELVQFLQKPAQDFTREDIMRFAEGQKISMIKTSGNGSIVRGKRPASLSERFFIAADGS